MQQLDVEVGPKYVELLIVTSRLTFRNWSMKILRVKIYWLNWWLQLVLTVTFIELKTALVDNKKYEITSYESLHSNQA